MIYKLTRVMVSGSKQSKKRTIRANAAKGKRVENKVKREYKALGYAVKPTGKGHDFKATKTSRSTGKKTTKYVEVKSGNAKLTPTQQRSKNRLGKKFVLERREPSTRSSTGKSSRKTKGRRQKK